MMVIRSDFFGGVINRANPRSDHGYSFYRRCNNNIVLRET
jgi:hypothetical protein